MSKRKFELRNVSLENLTIPERLTCPTILMVADIVTATAKNSGYELLVRRGMMLITLNYDKGIWELERTDRMGDAEYESIKAFVDEEINGLEVAS